MEIATPLGGETLLFYRMQATEELGRLSTFQIELLSAEPAIDPDGILGKNVTVTLSMLDDKPRHFNGFVTKFEQQGMVGRYHRYRALVQPWLWFLTRTADCRIFQDSTVPEILKKIFADHDTADFKLSLTATYRKWTYCVQYRETDFNFVSRLMEHEGIYYYFTHDAGRHTMVITDASSGHKPMPGYESVPFLAQDKLTKPDMEYIDTWDFSREVLPGVFVHDDYDLERPSVELKVQKSVPRTYAPSSYEMYDYPGTYVLKPDGEQYAGVRIEEFAAQYQRSRASTTARGIATGCLFNLEECPRGDQNREHLIVSANHRLEYSQYEAMPMASATVCQTTFVAMPSAEQFRTQRLTPKPFVQGPQTAVVVGPAGEEIYTDKYGRIKVQFHWDRRGKKDENSSCWIRVSHPWAGKAWGGIAIPRIGQEVIVDFLEGDPDQPIVTGRVYNAEQMPPYELPANKTQTGVKSRSSSGGSPANFNELRFEDKKGSEQVYLHAEKNQDIVVENDETHSVGHDRTKTVDNDETTTVKHDRTETVNNNETITVHGARTETVDKNETITVHQNRTISVDKNETATVTLTRTHSVGVNEAITVGAAQEVTVGAAQTVSVGAVQAISVGANQSTNVGKDQSTSVSGNQTNKIGKNISTDAGGDEARKIGKGRSTNVTNDDTLKVGKNLVLDAGDSVTIKTGSASITMKKDGTITIKGKDIKIEGSGKINVKASSDVVIKGSKVGIN